MRKVDWRSFCNAFGIKTGDIRKGMWLEVRCPFCDDHGTKGAVNLKSSTYHCWKCGKHSITEFVSMSTGCANDIGDVYRTLDPYFTERPVMTTTYDHEEDEAQGSIKLEIRRRPKGLKVPGKRPLSKAMKRYLRCRGFNATYLADKYDLHDGGVTGKWANRLIIPIYVDGKVVSWQGRHIGDSKLRYMAASTEESLNIKTAVYNLDNCTLDRAIVVEGIFDCWRLGDDTCALFGISVKDGQLMTLAERFDTVYFLFDPEPEAQARAEECARKIDMLGKKAYVLNMTGTDSGDPGELKDYEVVQIKELVFGDVPDYDYGTPQIRNRKE